MNKLRLMFWIIIPFIVNASLVDSLKEEGNKAYSNKEFNKAILIYKKLTQLDKTNKDFRFRLGFSYLKIKDYFNAENTLTKAIHLDNEFYQAYYLRAITRICQEKYELTISDIDKALIGVNDQTKKEIYYHKGFSLFQLKDYNGAIESYTRCINVDSINSDAFAQRALCKRALRNYIGAIQDYTKSLLIVPNSGVHLMYRGQCKEKVNDFYGALSDFNKAITFDPTNGEAYLSRGCLKCKRNDNEGCIDLSKAGELGLSEAYALMQMYCN